jgi:hypothetical protein
MPMSFIAADFASCVRDDRLVECVPPELDLDGG